MPRDSKTTPEATLGQIVVWMPCPTATPSECGAAVVTRPGKSISVSIFAPDSRVLETRDGVRHKDDPELLKFPDRLAASGCWDYTEQDKRVNSLFTV